ncbi:MAG: DUF935 domain-containing protein [Bacteroidetes bacterium]|nr:DUF935 domain-containing protein [Bacteroidota bacterium]
MKKNSKLNLMSEFATREKMQLYERFYTTLPDPDKILQANNYNYEIYRDLLTDPHLAAAIQQRKMQVLQMGWEVGGNENLIKETIDIIQNLDLQRIISDMLDAVYFGYAVGEIDWKLIDGKLVPINIKSKPQEWFIFDKDNKLRLRLRKNGSYIFEEGEELPEYKFIINQYQPTYVNPYGSKLLARCYWPVTFKRAGIEQWHLLSEKFGLPSIVGFYAIGATEEEKEELLDSITDMLEENVAVMKTGTEISFKENPKYEIGQLFEKLCEFHNNEISKAILTVTLTVDIGTAGSYGATEVHKEMLGNLGIADKKLVELGLNKLLRYYVDLNYGVEAETVKIKFQRKETIINESEQRDKILSEIGVKFNKIYFQKRYNLSEEEFELSSQ